MRSSSYTSYNYPDGSSVDDDEFICYIMKDTKGRIFCLLHYNCRTGKLPKDTSKPKSFWVDTKKGIVVLVIIMLLLSFGVWYTYNFQNKDVCLKIEGYSGEKTIETFTVEDEAEIEMTGYDPDSDNLELSLEIRDAETDELVGKATMQQRTSSRGKRHHLSGDTTLSSGEYYLVINNEGRKYKIQVIEKVL